MEIIIGMAFATCLEIQVTKPYFYKKNFLEKLVRRYTRASSSSTWQHPRMTVRLGLCSLDDITAQVFLMVVAARHWMKVRPCQTVCAHSRMTEVTMQERTCSSGRSVVAVQLDDTALHSNVILSYATIPRYLWK